MTIQSDGLAVGSGAHTHIHRGGIGVQYWLNYVEMQGKLVVRNTIILLDHYPQVESRNCPINGKQTFIHIRIHGLVIPVSCQYVC